MKKNLFLSLCGLFAIAALFSCTDGNTIGSSIQPSEDKIAVSYDTVHVKTETVFVDSVYLRNSVATLGEFTDPVFGTTKSDYMAQLYCARNFSFPDDVRQIDSAFIYFYYNNWFGDSTAIHHLNVYELTSPLNSKTTYYSNTDPNKYCDRTRLLAQASFTTGDLYTSDSVKALSNYSPSIRIPIDPALGQRFLNDSRTNPEYFSTPDNFLNYFKGIYVTTDYGNGSILYITHSEVELCYDTKLYSKTTGYRDSLVIGGSYFPITKEVKQINRTEHPDLRNYISTSTSDSLNYIFAPGGLFTKVTIPERIFTKNTGVLSGKSISSLRLKVLATQLDASNSTYAMKPPEALLLIDKSKAKTFFSEFDLNDGVYSFLAIYNSTDKNYVFNLSNYAQKMISEMDNAGSTTFKPFSEMLLIPVSIVKNSDGNQVRINHVMTPSAVKIRGGNHPNKPMKLEVVYTKSK